MSKRAVIGKVLTMPKDTKTIEGYSRPEVVLGVWTPVISDE